MDSEQVDGVCRVVEVYPADAEKDLEEWGVIKDGYYVRVQCWWKKEGEPVDEGEPLADLSDYVEVCSPCDGVVVKLLARTYQRIHRDAPIALIEPRERTRQRSPNPTRSVEASTVRQGEQARVPSVLVYESRHDWLTARRRGIGASDAAAIVGLNPFKPALAVYCEKLGIQQPEAEHAEAAEWGRKLEPLIADEYVLRTGRELQDPGPYAIHTSQENPFMLATLDREILAGPGVTCRGVLEIKTASAFKQAEWRTEAPAHYNVQVQHQLAVTGYRWGSIAALIGGQRLVWFDIERDEHLIEILVEAEERFWRHLQQQIPPEPDDKAARYLSMLYREDGTRPAVALTASACEWDEIIRHAHDMIRDAKRRKSAAENRIKAALGTATAGILPNGVIYTWKTQERKEYMVAAAKCRTLRRTAPRDVPDHY
jgi:putative phage-type endonuclease